MLKSGCVFCSRLKPQLRGLANFQKILLSGEVKDALESDKPLVALESTIITHGMPFPQNVECALAVEEVVRAEGAIPATIAVLDGEIKVGLDKSSMTYLGDVKSSEPIKTSRRDLSYVTSQGRNGGTTVSGTLIVANKVGIPVFATGGIGGVHRGGESSLDISADLTELGRCNVAVVSSGVKSILDVAKTLEFLETQGVFVATLGPGNTFPNFYSRASGFLAPYCVQSAQEAAKIIQAGRELNLGSGLLFAVPVPDEFSIDSDLINAVIERALDEAAKSGIQGKEITPFLLKKIADITGGQSMQTNIALIKNNAKTAAQIAAELSKLKTRKGQKSSGSNKNGGAGVPVVIGGSNLDCTIKLRVEEIKLDGRIHFGTSTMSGGGVARNICESLSKLGCSPFFLSVVGNDPQGTILRNFIPAENRDTVKVLEDGNTGQCTVVLDRKGQCKFLVGDMEIHKKLTPDMILENEDVIRNSPLVVFDSNISVQTIETILELAEKHQVPGLWEVCFKNFEEFRHQYDTRFTGCWWVFEEEYYIIHDFLLPGFFIATQFFYTLCMTLVLVAVALTWLYCFCSRDHDKYLILLMSNALNHWIAGLCGFISVLVFGLYGDSRDWMPYWQHNDLGWSYAFAVVGSLLLWPAGALFLVEGRRAKYRQFDRSRPASQYSMEAPKPSHTDI